ncbi:Cytochrome P450 [Macrophomina phaseolina MS6]|uniref:Cytochrome P450 n=1 Tax=Macrophomina phaseolina (strain MS6) TaxID=1126212 RepID=K2R9P2_MACPH|nr:Cytochrome P450 [Macrophomina phaseolina MS6]
MADWPEKTPSWQTLEKLPYLQACIKEGLRLSHGIMHRLPRCSPDVALQYRQWSIPKGTPVGMSAYFMHTDPDVYPDPFEFRPERWLGDVDPRMYRNYVPFTKGSRGCLGVK